MKSVGIICEYNPFHNGHLYHLNKVKELCPDHVIILIMSGSFLQRGESSIINKWDKVEIALHYGVDIIVELPYVFSTQSSDIFAKGSVELLNYLNVDKLIFGSESNDIELLTKIANVDLDNNELVKEQLKKGISYPKALSNTLNELVGIEINSPNDILGINYIKAINNINSNIIPISIKRTNDYHSNNLDNEIVSATSIRNGIKNNVDVNKYVPEFVHNYLQKEMHFIDNYYPFLKYKILTELNNLNKFHTVDEGIENRIKKYINQSSSLNELIMNVKTKRYTYNKLNRMFTHILCNFTKKEASNLKKIEYIRILGFSSLGRQYLNKIKKTIDIPIVTSFTKLNSEMLDLEFRVSCTYASILNEKDKVKFIEGEYKNKPFIK